jgi:hypothetical protein
MNLKNEFLFIIKVELVTQFPIFTISDLKFLKDIDAFLTLNGFVRFNGLTL